MIDNSNNDMGMTKSNEVVPMDQSNEWLQTLEGKIKGGYTPLKNKRSAYQYPVQVSNRQQRGVKHGE